MNGLSFFRPEFLWGLLFIAAALAIHLLMRPRRRALDFSTLRFFQESAVKTSRMRQLRKLLLLLTRLAAIALLILLFAQPFDKKDRLSLLRDPHLTVFTWIDRTPSMDYIEGSASLLSRACALVDSLRRRLPSTVRHYQYDETQGGFTLYDPSKPFMVRSRHGPANLGKMVSVWNEARAGSSLPLLVLISDYQKATTDALDSLLRRLPRQSRLLCVSVTPRNPWNYSLRAVRQHEADNTTKVSVTVATQGKRLDSGEITLSMGSIRTGHQRVSVAENDTHTVTLTAAIDANGPAAGRVELEEKDPLMFDNAACFFSGRHSAMRVIVVGDREKNFPVAAALTAAGKERWDPVVVKTGDEVTYDDLDSADIVVVNAMAHPSRQLEAFVTSNSSSKKAILFAPGADDESFSTATALLAKINSSAKPITLTNDTTAATLVLPDTLSELWQGFPGLRIGESAIYRYAQGLPGDALLRLDNGMPLVTHLSDNQERSWVIVGTPLGVTDANNLCETGFYVPFLDRIARFAASKIQGAPVMVIAGAEQRNPMYGTGKTASIFTETGKFIDRWAAQPNVVFKLPGLYKITPDGEEAYWTAVVPDTTESDLTYRLPTIPEPIKDNVLILNEKELIDALNGRSSWLSYLPTVLLLLALFAEVVLWEKVRK